MYRILTQLEQKSIIFEWKEIELSPFNELIVSWNAQRPSEGAYLIQVSLYTGEWTSFMDYAYWGVSTQHTFEQHLHSSNVRLYQDTVEVLENQKATGFKIRVMAKEGSHLKCFRAVYASMIDQGIHILDSKSPENVNIKLEVRGLSQLSLSDERKNRLCSPVSTTAVIRYLVRTSEISPLTFADAVVDSAFDIYGNWILNMAQASHELGSSWRCYVIRLQTFNQIVRQLKRGFPVVVSVKGSLKNSARSYDSGHLLAVKGYNSSSREVLCMDPANDSDELSDVRYDLYDFLEAWKKRGGLAYMFEKSNTKHNK